MFLFRRVYISYLDSIQYFRPSHQRKAFYHEILIGYLEYVKELGFACAHIWACPPKKGDDYIFNRHPSEQGLHSVGHLQEWYKTMFDLAVQRRVVVRYEVCSVYLHYIDHIAFFHQDIKDYADHSIKKVNDIPYFEGDYWADLLELLLEQFEKTSASRKGVSNEEPPEVG